MKEEAKILQSSSQEKKFLQKPTQNQPTKVQEQPKPKRSIKFYIPAKLRVALAWVIFFAIIGIIIQSIQQGRFVFFKFFGSNYVAWFKSFGSFVNSTNYTSVRQLFSAIFREWYYFFYTGGLISLLWGIVTSVVNSEFNFSEVSEKDVTVE